jgi:hypothetical protein
MPEDAGKVGVGNIRTRIRHGESKVAIGGRSAHAHLSCVRERDRIADEVEEHPGQVLLVAKPNG